MAGGAIQRDRAESHVETETASQGRARTLARRRVSERAAEALETLGKRVMSEVVTARPAAGTYLTFALAHREYGVPVREVREIVKVMDISGMPHLPPLVGATFTLRGTTIPLVDLRFEFGLPSVEFTDRTCIIVVEGDLGGRAVTLGVLVDHVSELLSISSEELEPPPQVGAPGAAGCIRGAARKNGSVTLLIEPAVLAADRARAGATEVRATPLVKRRLVIGTGEFAVTAEPGATIETQALGSGVVVCLFDPVAKVGGMIHVLLPDSHTNRERATAQPAAFADTGIPMLFHAAYDLGAKKVRCRVQLVGGAAIEPATGPETPPSVGRRNILAARQMLWRNGVLVGKEDVGGSLARNVSLDVADGTVQFSDALTGASVL